MPDYRASDLDRLQALVDEGHRLITVLGPGGAGKTTLVRRLAGRFVDLTACRTAADAEGALERAVGPDLDAVEGPVLLDNCEQVEGLAPAVARWCEHVRVVATSRTPLQLRDEQRYRLRGFADDDAVAFFVRRAALHGVTDLDVERVKRIVARLDGLPLAIELCASRVATLGLERVEALLDDPLAVLADRKADRPARHSSLERTLQWSWDLLGPEARETLSAASLFAGAFGLDDCDWIPVDSWVGDALEELVDACLVEHDGGRYRLLEGVRAFAAAHVVPSVRQAFWGWLTAREARNEHVEEGVLAFRNAREADPDAAIRIALWIDPVLGRIAPNALWVEVMEAAHALDPDHPHVRIRLAHALMDAGDAERPGGLLAGLEGHPDPRVRAAALAGMGRWTTSIHDMMGGRAYWEQARLAYQALGDTTGMVRALVLRASLDTTVGDQEGGRRALEEAVVLAREHRDAPVETLALAHLANTAHDMGDLDAAEMHLAAAHALFEATGRPVFAADVLANRAMVWFEREQYARAAQGLQEAIAVHEAHGARRWVHWYRLARAIARLLCGEADVQGEIRASVTALRAYAMAGTAEIGVMLGCLTVADPALAASWLDELRVRIAGFENSPILDAALRLVEAADDREAFRAVCDDLSAGHDGFPAMFDWSNEVRLVRQVAEKRPSARGFRYGDGWFEMPDGERVDLRTRAALRRILAKLVERRGGPGLTMEELFEAGWPGTDIHPDSAGNRVYTSIAALRKMGLSDVLVRYDDGYHLLEPG